MKFNEWGGVTDQPCRIRPGECPGGRSHDDSCATVIEIVRLRKFAPREIEPVVFGFREEEPYEAPADPLAHIRYHFK